MLMEAGVSYSKEKLHHRGYFHQLLANNKEIDESLSPDDQGSAARAARSDD
jgi:hypothetical protein